MFDARRQAVTVPIMRLCCRNTRPWWKNFFRYFIKLYQILCSSIYAYLLIREGWRFRNSLADATAW